MCMQSFVCAALCIKKALAIFRELNPRTRRRTRATRVAFCDLRSGSKNMKNVVAYFLDTLFVLTTIN